MWTTVTMIKKPLLTLLFLIMAITFGYSQTVKELIAVGDKFNSKKDYKNAIKAYSDALAINPDEASLNFKLGLAYLYSDTKSKAAKFIDMAYRLNPSINPKIDYYLGIAFQNINEYKKAIQHFEGFKKSNPNIASIADAKIMECHIADSLSQYELNVIIENMGNEVNTPFDEHSPILSADGNTLIFTSNRPDTPQGKEKPDDVFIITKSNNRWSVPKKISVNINTKFSDAAASLSPDGKTLFLYSELGAGDIYTSTFDGKDWTEPKPLNKNINTALNWETCATVSTDGKKLYFASSRDGGYGELDIYVSELDSHGQWGKAINLGTKINTPGNEDSPFIHYDGVSLYFSSDGHAGLGNSDIFISELKKEKWAKPENIGYPINLSEYDGFFTISRDKKIGYYSTVKEGGLGGVDIYSIKFLEPKYKPKPPPPVVVAEKKKPVNQNYIDASVQKLRDQKVVTVLRGKVIDENSAAPLNAIVTLVDNETGKIYSKIFTDPVSGDFELFIPHGGNYGVTTESQGYLFNSINFSLPKFAEYQEIDTHIIMVRAEVGSKVVLRNIFFDIGKFNLKDQSISEVEKVLDLLLNNPQLKVQINGHTDNAESVATNKSLSLKRASAVVDMLISKGVEQARVSAKGYGPERPIVSNDDEQEGREINRRTEIEIVGLK